ncbi:hypothetical protein FUAX_49520 (plasmid) [Fulvitalea axinellae]|uniref:Uncharacterized protein n=1 Tax=Fulvitalea axinellae TaxID=1182444 RepID=A0AAU9DMV1_9BACT|nr:hypothetical protein FUAX_49520 [Fulvitalea axinellae]
MRPFFVPFPKRKNQDFQSKKSKENLIVMWQGMSQILIFLLDLFAHHSPFYTQLLLSIKLFLRGF